MSIAKRARTGLLLAATAALSLVSLTSAGAAENRRVRIINETHHTMVQFFASNTSRDTWEEDILGDDVVKPGDDVMINVDDGTGHCLFDFKAVFDDKDVLIKKGVNVCKISSYRYSE
jgi:hypothetical protein